MKSIILAVLTIFNATPVSNVIAVVEAENTSQLNEIVSLTTATRGIQG